MAVSHQSIDSVSHSLTLAPWINAGPLRTEYFRIGAKKQSNLTHSIHEVLKEGQPYQFAIDFTHDPYYGEIVEENEDYIIRNRLKKSTTEFYSYITLYVITKDRQLTLAVFPDQTGSFKSALSRSVS